MTNRRTIVAFGAAYTLQEAADQIGSTVDVIRLRVRRGWSGERILSTPTGQASTWDVPIERDLTARAAVAVAAEVGGMNPVIVGEIMGCSRQMIDVIERRAIKKLATKHPRFREFYEALLEREQRKGA